ANAFQAARNDPEIVASILCMTGYVSEAAAGAALRCFSLIGSSHLSQDDAIAALDFCLQKQAEKETTFDEALQELGWSIDQPIGPEVTESGDFVADFASDQEETLEEKLVLQVEETIVSEAENEPETTPVQAAASKQSKSAKAETHGKKAKSTASSR